MWYSSSERKVGSESYERRRSRNPRSQVLEVFRHRGGIASATVAACRSPRTMLHEAGYSVLNVFQGDRTRQCTPDLWSRRDCFKMQVRDLRFFLRVEVEEWIAARMTAAQPSYGVSCYDSRPPCARDGRRIPQIRQSAQPCRESPQSSGQRTRATTPSETGVSRWEWLKTPTSAPVVSQSPESESEPKATSPVWSIRASSRSKASEFIKVKLLVSPETYQFGNQPLQPRQDQGGSGLPPRASAPSYQGGFCQVRDIQHRVQQS